MNTQPISIQQHQRGLEEAALVARLEAISAKLDAAIAPAQQWMCRGEVFFILDAAGSPAQAVA